MDYLNYVLEKINSRIQEINEKLAEGAKEVENMHDYYWENHTEMDEYGYENYDNSQALLSQINSNNEQLKLKERFRRMLDSPYFGRVDFVFEDEDEPEEFYIGIGNFSEGSGHTPLIYDWRAPISSLFYDFDKGEAYYQAPNGVINGEITSKWQYKIKNGKMVYGFESDVKIDDEVLKNELGTSSDIKLKSIIRTIQKEQNAIIRNKEDKILVIQGVAGSGKTSVALHRIAYILYHNRDTIKASNILILSPNGVFADYISHILPELGEENISEMSFDIFASMELRDYVPKCEERFDQIERELDGRNDMSVYHKKQSKEYMNEINGFVLGLEDSLMKFKNVSYKGIEKTAVELSEMFYYKFPDIPLLKRMDVVREYVVDEVETLKGKDFEEEDKAKIESIFNKMYKTKDIYKLYNWFLLEQDMQLLEDTNYENRFLKYEDLYPMLYLKQLLCGRMQQHANIRHLIIDEMQDYSYIQYEILASMFDCKMTILGDKAQTMESKTQDVTTFLPKILGKNIKFITMDKSYRNTAQIAQYANETGGHNIEYFDRQGEQVEVVDFSNMDEALDRVIEQVELGEKYDTAALITMNQKEALYAYRYLLKKIDKDKLCYIDKDSNQLKKGLVVTTFYCAKGLEFDQVFSIYEKKCDMQIHKQAKYISATRALHKLSVYTF